MGFAFLGLAAALHAVAGPPSGEAVAGQVAVILPLQNRAGDSQAGRAVEAALGERLWQHLELVDPGRNRRALRLLRIRNGDEEPAERLTRLAEALKVDWLITVTLHDAERRAVPRLTLSARAFSGKTGELRWAGFTGGSGLDKRKLLGLGRIRDLEALAPSVVRDLIQGFEAVIVRGVDEGQSRDIDITEVGTLAIVPLDSVTEDRTTANAETVTEAARAALHRKGIQLVSSGCAREVIRRQQAGVWGGVAGKTRAALQNVCGADFVLTGSVETYEVTGRHEEPEPLVAVAVRVLDTGTGRIVWMDAMERRGWDHQGLFRVGRVYSRGTLTEEVMEKLTGRLLREWDDLVLASGERR